MSKTKTKVKKRKMDIPVYHSKSVLDLINVINIRVFYYDHTSV